MTFRPFLILFLGNTLFSEFNEHNLSQKIWVKGIHEDVCGQ